MAQKYFIKQKSRPLWQKLMPLAVTAAVLCAFYLSVASLSSTAGTEQKRNLEAALRRGIMQCYALEGRYPPSLQYLLDNYPIYYNKDAFFVDYQTIGENIYPTVSVLERH